MRLHRARPTLALLFLGCHGASADVGAGTREAGPPTDAAAVATLAALSLSPLKLVPEFSPDIHDYYVRCGAGMNDVKVSALAAGGGEVALTRPTVTSPAPAWSAALQLAENDAIVAEVTQGSAKTEYWVRCLPHDFPQLAASYRSSLAAPGYYTVGNEFYPTGESGYAMVLDGRGTPVWYAATSTGGGAKDVEVLDGNTISFAPHAGYTFGDYDGQFEIHTLVPPTVSYVTTVGVPLDNHELRRLSNGNYLLLADPILSGQDFTGLSRYGEYTDAINCVVQEVTPDGQVAWQWNALDHFDVVKECTYPLTEVATTVAGQSAVVLDPFHCNSIDVADDGDLLVSARHLDAVFMISRATGKVMWKLGGASFNKDGAPHISVVGDPGFYRQHDARLNGDASITLFDDETSRADPARAIVLNYDLAAGTASIVWQYVGAAPVGAMGAFRIMPDGTRVIGWGTGAPAITEVDESHNELFVFDFSDRDESYRARKVSLTTLDVEAMRLAVGAYVQPDAGVEGPVDAGHALEAGAPSGCFAVTGSGSTEQCTYASMASGACPSGTSAGTCPSSGLAGCCVVTTPADGGTDRTATCYYDDAAAQTGASNCSFAAYEGEPDQWQTTAP